jgi:hypothetical protein
MKKNLLCLFAWFAALTMQYAGLAQVLPAANSAATRPMTASGTIYSPSGAPAPGVTLSVGLQSSSAGATVKSDANGRFTLTWQGRVTPSNVVLPNVPSYLIVARDVDHNWAQAYVIEETTSNLDLHLKPGLTLSTKVQSAAGQPISQAFVTLTVYSGGASSTIGPEPGLTSDDQGRIQASALPTGCRYSLTVSRAAGYGVGTPTAIPASATDTTRLELPAIVLPSPTRPLAGKVLDADGKPAAGARITVLGQGQPGTNTLSDAAGRFSLTVCDGSFFVSASLQGAVGREQANAGATNVIIRLSNTSANRASRGIIGTVFDPSGVPAPGVIVSVTPFGGLPQDIVSDAKGKFTVPWQPIRFVTPAGTAAAAMDNLLWGRDLEHNYVGTVKVDDKTTNVSIRLQMGITISGSVQDNNGAPVKNATAEILTSALAVSSTIGRPPATVGEQGAFAISALLRGQSYTLSVSAPGFGVGTLRIPATDTQTANLPLPAIKLKPADQRIEGQVVGPDGNPVAGATVRARGTGQPADLVRTDAGGHFAMKVCAGAIRLMASGPFSPGETQPGTGNTLVQSGDLNVVLKLAPRSTTPANRSNPGPSL